MTHTHSSHDFDMGLRSVRQLLEMHAQWMVPRYQDSLFEWALEFSPHDAAHVLCVATRTGPVRYVRRIAKLPVPSGMTRATYLHTLAQAARELHLPPLASVSHPIKQES